MTLDPSSAFALDVNSVAKLKYTAHSDSAKSVKQVSRQFEAMFIQKMLKSMRAAIPKSGLLHSQTGDTYQQMMDAQWSQTLAQRGIGLADLLTRQLQQKGLVNNQAKTAADPLAGIARADPKPLGASEPVAARNAKKTPGAAAAGSSGPLVAANAGGRPLFSLSAASAGQATKAGEPADYVARFIARMGSAADRAARRTGLPRRLILAQAALESGWGRHEIVGADGRASHNVFNIKATGWSGPSTSAATSEFQDGAYRATRSGFRVYGSYDQAFVDYARLLSDSPRYAPVLKAKSARAAARALQDCGYATDPAYADKLVAIMKQIPAAPRSAPSPLIADKASRPLVDLAAAGDSTLEGAAGPGTAMPAG